MPGLHTQQAATGNKRRRIQAMNIDGSPIPRNTPLPGTGLGTQQSLSVRYATGQTRPPPGLQESYVFDEVPTSQPAQGFQGDYGYSVSQDFSSTSLDTSQTWRGATIGLNFTPDKDFYYDESYEPVDSFGTSPRRGTHDLDTSFPAHDALSARGDYAQDTSHYTQKLLNREASYGPVLGRGMQISILQGSSNGHAIPAHSQHVSNQASGTPGSSQSEGDFQGVEGLECKWEGCTYKGNFGSRGALERHVKALHTNTQEFKCPDCDFVNGRRDKLQEHQRRKKHGNYIRLS